MKLKKGRFSKYKTLILILLGLSILGVIFFFPVNIHNQYTCLYQRLFSQEHSYSPAEKTDVSQTQKEDLLHRYLSSFGFIWWGSLLLTALSLYGLKRLVSLHAAKPPIKPPALRNNIDT
jgi:hypothetical protein